MQGYKYRATIRTGQWLGTPATAQNVAPSVGFPIPTGQAFGLVKVECQNRAASAGAVGIVGLLKDSAWGAGQVTAAGVYTADTTDAQDADTSDFPLEVVSTNGNGFLISADVPFGAVSIDVTAVGSAGAPVRIVEYWNGAWTTIAAAGLLATVPLTGQYVVSETILLFDPPADWVVGGSGTGVPAARYNLRVRSTTAPTTGAGSARRIYVGVPIYTEDQVAANGRSECGYTSDGVEMYRDIVSLQGIFGVSDEGNTFELVYTGA